MGDPLTTEEQEEKERLLEEVFFSTIFLLILIFSAFLVPNNLLYLGIFDMEQKGLQYIYQGL